MNVLDELFSGQVESRGDTRKDRCATDLELFCKTYFPDVFSSEFCAFHRDVFKKCEAYILDSNRGLKKYMARAAPRGHGKSQIISFGLELWCICYSYRNNILIVSDTADQAAQFITDIKIELEDNEALIEDFGNLVGDIWSSSRIVTKNGVHCVGKGAGQKLRGIKYNSVRPDLIVIDDLENDESVETEGQRAKLFNWFMKALLKCGYTDTIFIYIGTILSYESLLYKVLHDKKFAMWDRKIYRAVYKFSDSPLWDEWEKIITGVEAGATEEEEERIAQDAYNFYAQHKAEMLAGVVSLWPEKEPDYYYNLMVERVMDEESFNSEEQNDPITESLREFKTEWVQANLYTVLPEITDVYIGIDAAMTVKMRSDDSAIVVVGRGIDRKLYVMDVYSEKVTVDELIDQLLIYGAAYYEKIRRIAIEDVVFQILLKDLMEIKAIESGMYLPFEGVTVRQRKELKLRSLVIPVRNGYFKFREDQKKLLNEMKRFPRGADNAMDALWIATTGILGGTGTSSFGFGAVGGGKKKLDKYWRW